MKCSHSITLKERETDFFFIQFACLQRKLRNRFYRIVNIMACEVIVAQKSPFTEKLGFWRKIAKIWHKVQENGTKKIRLAKMVAEEKKS